MEESEQGIRDGTSGREGDEVSLAPDVATSRASDKPSDVVAFVGYLGEGDSPDHRRLYESQSFELWIEIPVAAIVDRLPAAGGDLTAGRSVLWVHNTATVIWCQCMPASSFQEQTPPQAVRPMAGVWPRPAPGD